MIVTELYNGQGLGNQIWCYVVTRAIAQNKGYDFGIMSPEKFKGKDFMTLDFGREVTGGLGPEGGPPKSLPDGITTYYQEQRTSHPKTGADIRIYDADLMDVLDNTKIDGVMQDERYIANRKKEIGQWLAIKPEDDCHDFASDNICVINFRGGEYTANAELFLPKKYWDDAVAHMRKINRQMKFVVITDDVATAKQFFPKFPVHHFTIGKDYSIIKNAHALILSNSSFAWFPAWLNQHAKVVIAPKYWARHAVSDGYWSPGYACTTGWHYLDRDGKLTDYQTCQRELKAYNKTHNYYPEEKIKKNFLVISNFNRDLRWIPKFTDNYVIYDRSTNPTFPATVDRRKIIKSPNVGYNTYDYFTYIIDNYDKLPDCTIFAKSWSFPRHVRKEYFVRVMNNECFTPLEDWKMHQTRWPKSFFSPEGGFCEINNSWYFKHLKHKYFNNYNDFLRYVYKDPIIPRYVRFAPGGDYIVPKANILKLPKVLYQNMRLFVAHCDEPAETHMIERAMHTLWTSNFELNEDALIPLEENVDMTQFLVKKENRLQDGLKAVTRKIRRTLR